MYSIGELARRTKVKIPTIRYYEDIGLLDAPDRTAGNQRRFDRSGLERLGFIKHARDLGFSIEAISDLIDLQRHPDRSCRAATDIAKSQLSDVRMKIERLRALESELVRISGGCDGEGVTEQCSILGALADHRQCQHDH